MFFSKKNVKVYIRNLNKTIETSSGTNLYKLLINEKLVSPTLCNGSGQCGRCKVRYTGKYIPAITNKEELILARVSLSSGHRLACRHTVKHDIEIDISDMTYGKLDEQSPSNAYNINAASSSDIAHNDAILNNDNNPSTKQALDNTPTKVTSIKPIIEQNEPPVVDNSVSISEFQTTTKVSMLENHDTEGSSDGIFMVQMNGGVRYFCYSAALDNIVSEGIAETNEHLVEMIDMSLVPDFVHVVLKIKDIDRVLILIPYQEQYNQQSTNFLDMMRYFKFEIGTLLCEVMMPHTNNHDIVRFLRLLTVEKQNRLIISLDMLDRVHIYNQNLLLDMRNYSLNCYNLAAIKPAGTNNILEFDNELTATKFTKNGLSPDGVSLPALLQVVKWLLHKGLIDNQYKLKSRTELIKSNVDLNLTIKLIGNNQPDGIYLYRDRFSELTLSQRELDDLFQIRCFIRTLISYVREYISDIDGLSLYSSTNYDNIVNSLIDLGFIPKEFASKVAYHPGDTTVHAIKLFKDKNLETFINNNMDNVKTVHLNEDERFMNKAISNLLQVD